MSKYKEEILNLFNPQLKLDGNLPVESLVVIPKEFFYPYSDSVMNR